MRTVPEIATALQEQEEPGETVTNPNELLPMVIFGGSGGGFRPLANAHPQPPALGVRAAKNG